MALLQFSLWGHITHPDRKAFLSAVVTQPKDVSIRLPPPLHPVPREAEWAAAAAAAAVAAAGASTQT